MWTIVREEHFPYYIQRYPQLNDFANELALCVENGLVFLPRWFFYNYPAPDLLMLHQDPNWAPIPIDVQFTGALRENQPEIVAPLIHGLTAPNGRTGILKARPGAGKTVMSIYLGCYGRQKSLICIDNTNLLKQWVESVYKFTNIQPTGNIDPSIFDSEEVFTPDMAKEFGVGIIQGNIFDVDHPFTVAMVQTLVSKAKRGISDFYVDMRDAGFGTWFFDECHKTVSGPKYSTAALFSNTSKMIGLSATPYANGLQDILMTNTIGPIVSDTKYYDLKPEVCIIKFDSGLTETHSKFVLSMRDMLKQRARWNKISVKSAKYFELLNSLNSKLLAQDHRIINIVFTQDQVHQISDHLTNQGIENRQFYSKKRKLDKATDKVLVATYSYAGTGFDFKQLSACIIACPLSGKKSLIQTIGRILREHEGKQAPRVFMLIDCGFAGTFVRDIPRITKILQDEFNCNVKVVEVE